MVRVLQGRRERGHDFAAVSKVASNFRPSFSLAHMIEAALAFNCLFESIQVQRPLVDTRKTIQIVPMLLVKLCELVQIVIVNPISAFD